MTLCWSHFNTEWKSRTAGNNSWHHWVLHVPQPLFKGLYTFHVILIELLWRSQSVSGKDVNSLLRAQNWTNCSICSVIHNSHNNIHDNCIITLIFKWRNWGTEKVSYLHIGICQVRFSQDCAKIIKSPCSALYHPLHQWSKYLFISLLPHL